MLAFYGIVHFVKSSGQNLQVRQGDEVEMYRRHTVAQTVVGQNRPITSAQTLTISGGPHNAFPGVQRESDTGNNNVGWNEEEGETVNSSQRRSSAPAGTSRAGQGLIIPALGEMSSPTANASAATNADAGETVENADESKTTEESKDESPPAAMNFDPITGERLNDSAPINTGELQVRCVHAAKAGGVMMSAEN